jgi:hypothetical protein
VIDQRKPSSGLLRHWQPWEWLLLALGLGLHGGLVWAALRHHAAIWDDGVQFLTFAQHLRGQGVWSQAYTPAEALRTPDIQRLPGYPVLLAALGGSIPLVLVLQHLLLGLMAVGLAGLGLRLGLGPRPARLVGWVWWLAPQPALFASMILTESLFMALTLVAVGALLFYLMRGGWLWLGGALLAATAATLVKGLGLLLVLASGGAWLWLGIRDRIWLAPRHSLASYALAGVLLATVPLGGLGPWAIRYHGLTGQWGLGQQGHIHLIYGQLGGVLAPDQASANHEARINALTDSLLALRTGSLALRVYQPHNFRQEALRYTPAARAAATKHFGADWAAQIRMLGRGIWQMLRGLSLTTAWELTACRPLAVGLAAVQAVWVVGVYGGMLWLLAGVLRRLLAQGDVRLLNPVWGLPLCVGLGLLLLHVSGYADGRYRMVADPMLLLALAGLWALPKPADTKPAES